MSILTVQGTVISVGMVEVDAYTANEINPVTKAPINYLSGLGLAESINLTDKTTRPKSLPKELKDMLAKDFTIRPGKYKNSTNAYSKVNLWDTASAAVYYFYHALQGNEKAKRITTALMATSLDIIINDKFKREYEAGQAELWTKARVAAKEAFWTLGDAIKAYKLAHPEKSENYHRFVYSNCQDCINRKLFGKAASAIREELKVADLLRDHYGQVALKRIELIQSLAAANIIHRNIEPLEAVKSALEMYGFEVIDYSG